MRVVSSMGDADDVMVVTSSMAGTGNTRDVTKYRAYSRCFAVAFLRRLYVFHSPIGTHEGSGSSSTVAYTLDHDPYSEGVGGSGWIAGKGCWSGIPNLSDTVTTKDGKCTMASALVVTLMEPTVEAVLVVFPPPPAAPHAAPT